MDKIRIGDRVQSKHGTANITTITIVSPNAVFPDDDDGIPMEQIFACDKDRCVFDLDNGHWSWGPQIELIAHKTENHGNA